MFINIFCCLSHNTYSNMAVNKIIYIWTCTFFLLGKSFQIKESIEFLNQIVSFLFVNFLSHVFWTIVHYQTTCQYFLQFNILSFCAISWACLLNRRILFSHNLHHFLFVAELLDWQLETSMPKVMLKLFWKVYAMCLILY